MEAFLITPESGKEVTDTDVMTRRLHGIFMEQEVEFLSGVKQWVLRTDLDYDEVANRLKAIPELEVRPNITYFAIEEGE